MAEMVASQIHVISAHKGDVTGVAFANETLATVSADKTVRLWSSRDFREQPPSPLLGHGYIIHHCTFSPLGETLATCSTDGKLLLWDVSTAEKKAVFQHPSQSGIRVCQFSPDSSRIASGSDDDTICIWDIATTLLVRTFSGLEDSVVALAYSPDGHFLASGSPNGDLHVWDAVFGHGHCLSLRVDAHDLGVTCCQFSPTFGSACTPQSGVVQLLLATGGKDNLVRLWTFQAKVGCAEVLLKCHASLPGHSDIVMACAFSPRGDVLASGSFDKTVRLWDPVKGVSLFSIEACHSRFVTCCAFSRDGSLLATGSMDRTVNIWKLTDTGPIMYGLSGYEEPAAVEERGSEVSHPIQAWSVQEVGQWLNRLGMAQYQDAFLANAIDGKELLALTTADLERHLGVAAFGHRSKVLRSRDGGGVVPADRLCSSTASGQMQDTPPTTASSSKTPCTPSGQGSVEDVVQWLGALGLSRYQDSFRENAIDGTELLALNDSDLSAALGVAALGHRNKILRSREEESDKGSASPKTALPAKRASPGAVNDHDEFLCPISKVTMIDPVIAADGHTYERGAILAWLQRGEASSPVTKATLTHTTLTPNRTLKMLIQRHLEHTTHTGAH